MKAFAFDFYLLLPPVTATRKILFTFNHLMTMFQIVNFGVISQWYSRQFISIVCQFHPADLTDFLFPYSYFGRLACFLFCCWWEFWSTCLFLRDYECFIIIMNECNIITSKFEFLSRKCIHFWAYTLGKGMNPLIPSIYGLNSTTTILLQG